MHPGDKSSDAGNERKDEEFSNLVKRTQNKVRNICYRFVNNSDEAKDIAQEVYIQIYQTFSVFTPEKVPENWVFRIAVTKSIDHIRHKQRKKRFGSVASFLKIGNENLNIDPPNNENPHNIIENKQRNEILYKAINLLPEKQRIAITLNKIEGFTNTDIAEIMGMRKNSVDSYIFKARIKLKKILEKYYSDLTE